MAVFRLSAEERDFFRLVQEAVFTNPFSDNRAKIDRRIAQVGTSATARERIEKTIHEVDRRIKLLQSEKRSRIESYAGEDRGLIEKLFLFEFFYHSRDRFDRLILDQLEAEASLKFPFAREAIARLISRGFEEESAYRYFAICYQIRRAFFFIGRHLVGRSPSMKKLRHDLWNQVFTHDLNLYDRYMWNRMEDFSTLILGETGTGKGTAAMAIGRSGFIPFNKRKSCFYENFNQVFVPINLSQFPETLIESELFGHRKGAFTGATEDHDGIFKKCSPYGSIFLDEIGDTSMAVQIKLLQILQDRVFSPVGSHEKYRFRGRVIAATNRSIHEIRARGAFRDDFYYRLCSGIISIPSLKERLLEDPRELEDLVKHTVSRIMGEPFPELVALVLEVVETQLGKGYPWPGNVRELEQCVRRILLDRSYAGDIRPCSPDLEEHLTDLVRRGNIQAHELLAGYCFLLYQKCGTFEEAARHAGLDSRTLKKYIREWKEEKRIAE